MNFFSNFIFIYHLIHLLSVNTFDITNKKYQRGINLYKLLEENDSRYLQKQVRFSCRDKEDEGHYEHTDCKKYWHCLYVGTIFETALERKCPVGTMFHPIGRVCEISTLLNCQGWYKSIYGKDYQKTTPSIHNIIDDFDFHKLLNGNNENNNDYKINQEYFITSAENSVENNVNNNNFNNKFMNTYIYETSTYIYRTYPKLSPETSRRTITSTKTTFTQSTTSTTKSSTTTTTRTTTSTTTMSTNTTTTTSTTTTTTIATTTSISTSLETFTTSIETTSSLNEENYDTEQEKQEIEETEDNYNDEEEVEGQESEPTESTHDFSPKLISYSSSSRSNHNGDGHKFHNKYTTIFSSNLLEKLRNFESNEKNDTSNLYKQNIINNNNKNFTILSSNGKKTISVSSGSGSSSQSVNQISDINNANKVNVLSLSNKTQPIKNVFSLPEKSESIPIKQTIEVENEIGNDKFEEYVNPVDETTHIQPVQPTYEDALQVDEEEEEVSENVEKEENRLDQDLLLNLQLNTNSNSTKSNQEYEEETIDNHSTEDYSEQSRSAYSDSAKSSASSCLKIFLSFFIKNLFSFIINFYFILNIFVFNNL